MKNLAFAFLVFVFGAGATLGTLGSLSRFSFSTLLGWNTPQVPEGAIPVPVSVAPIPAFKRIDGYDLINKNNLQTQYVYININPQDPPILDINMIIGRVLNKDKQPLKAFYERDFLPEGTRPGLVGGIPAGKRSIVLPASSIPGVHSLQLYDKVDLLTVTETPVESEEEILPEDRVETLGKRVVVLAENAIVIRPVYIRQIPYQKKSGLLGENVSYHVRPEQEIILAVEPAETTLIAATLQKESSIIAVARSGHPDEDGTKGSYPPALRPIFIANENNTLPKNELTVIESIVGEHRDFLYFGDTPGIDPKKGHSVISKSEVQDNSKNNNIKQTYAPSFFGNNQIEKSIDN